MLLYYFLYCSWPTITSTKFLSVSFLHKVSLSVKAISSVLSEWQWKQVYIISLLPWCGWVRQTYLCWEDINLIFYFYSSFIYSKTLVRLITIPVGNTYLKTSAIFMSFSSLPSIPTKIWSKFLYSCIYKDVRHDLKSCRSYRYPTTWMFVFGHEFDFFISLGIQKLLLRREKSCWKSKNEKISAP